MFSHIGFRLKVTVLVLGVYAFLPSASYAAEMIAAKSYVDAVIAKKENISDKVTSISSQSTDAQYPSAKAVYGMFIAQAQSELLNLVYPVGSIYISVSDANPGALFGGTWERFGNGRALVGVSESETEFNAVMKTGGAKTHTLAVSEIPAHNHSGTANSAGAHTHRSDHLSTFNGSANGWQGSSGEQTAGQIASAGAHTHSLTINNTGGGAAHNNLQPYIAVYMWKRTN